MKRTFIIALTSIVTTWSQAQDNIQTLDLKHKKNKSPITVKGDARLFAVYRNMSDQYSDAATLPQNLSFTSYPLSGAGSGNSGGIPLLNLELESNPSPSYGFKMGYSLSHAFNGLSGDSSKVASARSNLQFGGHITTDAGQFKIEAGGGVLWTSLSAMTLHALDYQDDEFDRLPWDEYHNSWEKYADGYESSNQLGGESYEDVATQGITFEGSGLPMNLGFKGFYGRSWAAVDQERARNRFPSNTAGLRVTKNIQQHQIGLNYFAQNSRTFAYSDDMDQRSITSVDLHFNTGRIQGFGELAYGQVNNPDSPNESGLGFMSELSFHRSITKLPVSLRLFHIDKNVASNASAVMNSNQNARAGGFQRDPKYNTQEFINPTLQIGQFANNRQGLQVSTSHDIKSIKIELGLGISRELESISDTILFLHRANAFSRSRFTPWIQDAGPYGRIKNIFRRSFERLDIKENEDYTKHFSLIDLKLKYKTAVFGKGLILKNLSSLNTIKGKFAPFSGFNDDTYLSAFYNQTIAFLQISKRFTLVGFFELERNQGNEKTNLAANGKSIDQTGTGTGAGIDFDYSEHAGLYLRHRWLKHQDNNFDLDYFKGQETTLELKIFF